MSAAAAGDPLAELARLEGVPSAVSAARDAVDAVLRDRGRRAVSPEQSATAMLLAARASAELESSWLPGSAGCDGSDHAGVDHHGVDHETAVGDDHEWGPATVRLYADLVELAGLIRVSPGQAIARAHAVLARDLVADDDLGRIRPGTAVADRMTGLNRLLVGDTGAPVIVVAGIAHAELITVAPFLSGNGIVARAVEHMILINGEIDRPPVTVPEAAHREAGKAYRQALDGYRSGRTGGVRDWLLHVAAAISRGAELSPLKPVRRS